MKLQLIRAVAPVLVLASLVPTSRSQTACGGPEAPPEFRIELMRLGTEVVVDQGKTVTRIFGDVGLNNKNIGRLYENPSVAIAAGTYRGLFRYNSDHKFVQSACGELAINGDFLIEVSGVKDERGNDRTAILLHPGMLPSHSRGCVLMGARNRDSNGNLLPLDASSPLVKLRSEFYGTENPLTCPNKRITIIIG